MMDEKMERPTDDIGLVQCGAQVIHIPLPSVRRRQKRRTLSHSNPNFLSMDWVAWCGARGLLVRNGYDLGVYWCEQCIQNEWESW